MEAHSAVEAKLKREKWKCFENEGCWVGDEIGTI
jgi:hypothetical protein